MSAPIWLYEHRKDKYSESRRFGRRPVVATWMGGDEYTSAAWLAQLGRVCFGFGPAGGIAAGHASLPSGTRERLWFVRGGRAIGVALLPREVSR
jgi:hypothetical protein